MSAASYDTVRLGFVGVGTIASAVIRGLCGADRAPSSVLLSPRGQANTSALKAEFKDQVRVASSNQEVVDGSDWVVVALLTSQAESVLSGLSFRSDQTVISLMASIPRARLVSLCTPATSIVIAIPLPSVQSRQGITILTPPATPVTEMFRALGTAVEAQDEKQLQVMMPMTCVMGVHFEFMAASARWLTKQGVGPDTAAQLVDGVYSAFGAEAKHALHLKSTGGGVQALEQLVADQTPGGLNEGNIKRMRAAQAFAAFENCLDVTLKGLTG